MRYAIAAGALALCLPAVSGCFDVEQAMKLQKDLSGEVGFSMTVDMEPMVLFMLKMQREMNDQKGEPTPAEIAKAKKEFLASGQTKTTTNMGEKAEMEKGLPPGVKLLSSAVKEDGLRIIARFNFASITSRSSPTSRCRPKRGRLNRERRTRSTIRFPVCR